MLKRLFGMYLGAYKRWIWLLVVLQCLQGISLLLLPALNANIIDNGALKGDTSYIYVFGTIMLVVSVAQVCFMVGATFYGSRTSMAFGRDMRRDLFHTVIGYSAREVGQFGAPSLITRITNDVTQVQVFTLLMLTMFINAPIMAIGGTIFAIREDGSLSLILAVAIPLLILTFGRVVYRMHPEFMKMQERIDRVNQVLREQITGIRVVRAFVREPDETARFARANDAVTETSLKTGRMMALSQPIVLATINLSSVAAVWFGASRINAGQMQVGSLVAFLTYLIQILSAVMMTSFALMMWPRASVCAKRILEVLDTDSSVVLPVDGIETLPGDVSLELRHASFSFAGAEAPVLRDINVSVAPGETACHHREHRLGEDRAAEPDRSPLRRHRGAGAHRGRRRARDASGAPRAPHRIRASEAVPLLGHDREQRALRQRRCHRRRGVGSARGRPGARLRGRQTRPARRAHRPGWHQRVGRPASAPGDRPGARPQAADLHVRRLVLRPRPRDRRAPAGRAGAGRPRTRSP